MLILILFQTFLAVQYVSCVARGENLTAELCYGGIKGDGDQSRVGAVTFQAAHEVVRFQYYYETGCRPSIQTYIKELLPIVKELGPYLDITTYPFGQAVIKRNGTQVRIECTHGPEECYGNGLHACAIDVLRNVNKYALFNSCLMDQNNISNDVAADACGKKFNINPEPIKNCAKNLRGFRLLLYYGIESSNKTNSGVPWWYINGVARNENDRKPLKELICDAFKNPPKSCTSSLIHPSSRIQ